jgi:hypothetical protein
MKCLIVKKIRQIWGLTRINEGGVGVERQQTAAFPPTKPPVVPMPRGANRRLKSREKIAYPETNPRPTRGKNIPTRGFGFLAKGQGTLGWTAPGLNWRFENVTPVSDELAVDLCRQVPGSGQLVVFTVCIVLTRLCLAKKGKDSEASRKDRS